jgi:hypothetical protein
VLDIRRDERTYLARVSTLLKWGSQGAHHQRHSKAEKNSIEGEAGRHDESYAVMECGPMELLLDWTNVFVYAFWTRSYIALSDGIN